MNILELGYLLGYRVSRAYETYKQRRLKFPVISVGNLTVGGTGKTPAVIAIAGEALKRGYRPCILTRGYRGKIKTPVIVSKGNGPLCSPFDAGDEAFLMAERLKGVEVVKSADRYEGGLLSEKANLFIIDDGFQHWRLHRDRDIVLIDSIYPFGNGKLLPLGRLREPVSAIKRADTVIVTRTGKAPDRLIGELKKYNKNADYYLSDVKSSCLAGHDGELHRTDELEGKRVYAFCGIGNPGAFVQTILRFGISLVGFKSFRDHHIYSENDISGIRQEAVRTRADMVVMTEKDLVKLNRFKLPGNFIALRIDFDIDNIFYDNVLSFNNRPKPK